MLYQDFFIQYYNLYRPLIAAINRMLAPYQLFNVQWAVLKRIKLSGPGTTMALAKIQAVEPPTMTATVKKLVSLGYVEARRGEDGREKPLYLTEKGERVFSEVQPRIDALYAKITANASAEDMRTAVALLETLTQALIDENAGQFQ